MKRSLAFVALALAAMSNAQPAPNANQARLQAETKQLKSLELAYGKTKSSLAKAPKEKAARKAHVDATVRYADAVLVAKSLMPKDKYPKALSLYREALKLDPTHKGAAENKATIEGIYRSMGRPIPK